MERSRIGRNKTDSNPAFFSIRFHPLNLLNPRSIYDSIKKIEFLLQNLIHCFSESLAYIKKGDEQFVSFIILLVQFNF